MTFRHVCILHHPKKTESQSLATAVSNFLQEHGIADVRHATDWEAVIPQVPELDLLITLGGDGTLLRGARVSAAQQLPMLGIKMGRLGFLAEVMPDDWQRPVAQLLTGNYWIEERCMVRARVERSNHQAMSDAPINQPEQSNSFIGAPDRPTQSKTLCEYDALNEVVFARGDLARVVRIRTELDGSPLTQYTCDGLIVCTATGSTGYALAVGGPILPPELRNMLLIPIAPHLSMDRAIVLSEGAEIRMHAYSDHRSILTIDGQMDVVIEPSDEVIVTASPHRARFIRLRHRNYFYQNLMDKLRWTA